MGYRDTMRIILVGCVLAAACGGGDSIAIGDLVTKLRAAECNYYVRCGLFANVADCEAEFGSVDQNLFAAVDAGKVKYDGEAAASCLSQLEHASCDSTKKDVRESPDACADTFTGTLAADAACAFNQECQSGDCIPPASCTMACCIGTCAAELTLAKAGEACTAVRCDHDLFCDDTNVCQPLLAAGTACQTDDQCAYGLGCAGTGAMTCQVLPKIGEACPGGDCAEINAHCNGQMSCVAYGLPGDACAGDADCSFFYTCDTAMGKCTSFPSRGMPCTDNCSGDSWCNIPTGMTTGTCDAPQANGATCEFSNECSSRHCDFNVTPSVCADVAQCI
jgi:hypothetical protein